MASKINHVAILSQNYALLGKFYESMFGMKVSSNARPSRAVSIGDGYVGMNINPRRAGRPARLDHFGIQVDEVEVVYDRLKTKYPRVQWLERPSSRPYAGVTTHDPNGNVFDLSQEKMENRKDVYVDNNWQQDRTISHLGLRTLDPEQMAEFYIEVFDLAPANLGLEEGSYGVTDGRMTLAILPWRITDYQGTGIVGPGLDYIGFKVESIEAFDKEVNEIGDRNPLIKPAPLGTGPEGVKRLEMLQRTSLGSYHLADPDGVLLDIVE